MVGVAVPWCVAAACAWGGEASVGLRSDPRATLLVRAVWVDVVVRGGGADVGWGAVGDGPDAVVAGCGCVGRATSAGAWADQPLCWLHALSRRLVGVGEPRVGVRWDARAVGV